MNLNHIVTSLSLTICDDASDAISKGFTYSAPGSAFKPIGVKDVVVVRNGTATGNPTVDFVLEDETGQKYVFMITGNLLKTIAELK